MLVKFPYNHSRRVFSRRPRRSKNGTPEERAARAAAAEGKSAAVVDLRDRTLAAFEAATSLDPIFGLIERWKDAFAASEKEFKDDLAGEMAQEAAFTKANEAKCAVFAAVPITVRGIRAKIDFVMSEQHITQSLTSTATDEPLRKFLDTLYEAACLIAS